MQLKYFLLINFISVALFNPLSAIETHDIHIELPASNMSIAREQAFDQARLIAIKQYAKLNPTDADRINQLQDDPLTRSRIIQNIKVIKEEFKRQRYTCFLNVTFNPEQLSRFLKPKISSNLKAINSNRTNTFDKKNNDLSNHKKMLILPIYISEDESLLWEDGNLWRTSWQNQEGNQKSSLMNYYTVPLSDLSDQMICSIEDAMTERSQKLALISRRYHQENIIITILKKLGGSEDYELIVKFVQPNKPVKVYETYHLDNIKNLSNEARFRHAQRLTLHIIDCDAVPDNLELDPQLKLIADPLVDAEKINSNFTDKKSRKISNDIQAKDKQDVALRIDEQSETPAERSNDLQQKTLEPQNNSTTSSSITLTYSAKFSNLKQWQMIRQTIRQTEGISNFRIRNLSTGKASFNFDYDGNATQLVKILSNRSLQVTGKGEEKRVELTSNIPSDDDVSINESLGY